MKCAATHQGMATVAMTPRQPATRQAAKLATVRNALMQQPWRWLEAHRTRPAAVAFSAGAGPKFEVLPPRCVVPGPGAFPEEDHHTPRHQM